MIPDLPGAPAGACVLAGGCTQEGDPRKSMEFRGFLPLQIRGRYIPISRESARKVTLLAENHLWNPAQFRAI